MRNKDILLKYLNFGVLSIVLIISVTVAILSNAFQDSTPTVGLYLWAIEHHIAILLFSIIISIAFGFTLSSSAIHEIKQSEVAKKGAKDVVFTFLSEDEKLVINHLLTKKKAAQSDLGKINDLGRVRAHRCVQKLLDKNLVKVESHGKLKIVCLKEDIRKTLID